MKSSVWVELKRQLCVAVSNLVTPFITCQSDILNSYTETKMVTLLASSLTCSSPGLDILSSIVRTSFSRKHRAASVAVVVVATSSRDESSQKPTKFVTFLGKGGSGKTTASVFAAQVNKKKNTLLVSFSLNVLYLKDRSFKMFCFI